MFARRRSSLLVVALLMGSSGAIHAQQQPPYDPNDPAAANMADSNQPDPPQRVARISLLQGTASFEPASVNEFSPAEINYPMTTGDRLYSGDGALAEIQTGQIAVRLGTTTDVTVTAMTDTLAQFGLAGGSVHLRTYAVDAGTTTELDTPNVAITVLEPGDIRVDVDPNSDTSWLTVISGRVQVDGSGYEETIGTGQSLRLEGLNPLDAQNTDPAQQDALDQFSLNRDGEFLQGQQTDAEYVNHDTIGSSDLAGYGDWDQDAENGAVWYPRGVAVDWQPYRVGHWAWIAPWGWTWVEAEPWGFAPFHYGRWARFGNRWGWVPGPRVVRPVWAPALVVFVGGDQFSASLGYRGGVTAWFPLGPREVYSPWYHTSPLYLNRVNVSNLYNRDGRAVRLAYNQRTVIAAYGSPMTGRGYANRGAAVVVPQAAFAAGRPAAQNAVRVSPQQMSSATLLPHPLVTPAHEIVQPGVARALPPHVARPVLDARDRAQVPVQGQATIVRGGPVTNGGNASYNRPGSQPVSTRIPAQGNPQQGVVPVRGTYPPNQGIPGVQGHPVSPTTSPETQVPSAPVATHTPPTTLRNPQTQPAPTSETRQNPRGGESSAMHQPTVQKADLPPNRVVQQPMADPAQPRGLFTRATPPEPRPSFEQQRQAMENTDPGRPLSPRQMDNVRQNQPAGPPQQHESAPHPAPEAHPAPAQARPAPQPSRNDHNSH